MNRRESLTMLMGALAGGAVLAADEAPDALIARVSSEVLEIIKADKSLQSGDVAKIMALVDARVMPHVNFQRMTEFAVGPAWRQATPDQRRRLQEEYKLLLVRTYSGALSQVSSDQRVVMLRMRGGADDAEVEVRSEVRGRGDPIPLNYRLEKTPGQGAGWKIYDLNVLGVWLGQQYRSQFGPELSARGVDGLIALLSERNRAGSRKSGS